MNKADIYIIAALARIGGCSRSEPGGVRIGVNDPPRWKYGTIFRAFKGDARCLGIRLGFKTRT